MAILKLQLDHHVLVHLLCPVMTSGFGVSAVEKEAASVVAHVHGQGSFLYDMLHECRIRIWCQRCWK